ncbi:dehydrogenase/reductase SDR family member 12-like [Pollicipes pollicipes]|uniref:dehydrogenase/reductase SDR family member 12-like n=1 Tax=Pollicipes pollicipes TaxID=41117 RepID=UPI0018858B57|nr:dehydrogenase/reductase SDR family member 12-like [Pollicipes pollicipes]
MSWYRNSIFVLKGLKEYTKGGYVSASKCFAAKDLDVDCNGKSFMITGANSGIGKALAVAIAKLGGTIHMVCRNPTYAEEAMKEIRDETGNPNIHVHILDMSQPKNIAKFAEKFMDEHESLNVLVNNAGCMVNERRTTDDGLEMNFATNTLGVHMLTKSLLPLLKRSDQPRVIMVASAGMLTQKLNLADLQSEKMKTYDGTMVYAQNKRQQVIMTEQYAAEHPEVKFFSMHPGWADTPAVKTSMPDFYNRMQGKFRTPEEGADTALWLAVSDAAKSQPSGEFYQDRRVVPKHLPLAWTHSSTEEHDKLMAVLDDYFAQFSQ